MKKVLLFSFLVFSTAVSYSQWQPDVRLTNNPAVSQTSLNYGWSIAASGDTVHIYYFDERNGGYTQVYYKRSVDKGITWGPDIRLTNTTTWAERGSIAVNGAYVHTVWQDWRNPSWEIYYKRSTDAGTTWESDVRLTNDPGNSWGPGVCVSGNSIHVFWSESRDGNMEAYYKRSPDAGISWGPDVRLTNNSADSWYPVGAASGQIVHVMWTDMRDGNYEIYYKRSTDNGLTWGSDTRLTNTPSHSQNPSVALNGSTVHLVWFDDRDGNYEMYYKRSTDAGLNWGPDTRLTNAAGQSATPSLACSGLYVHLTWEDDRDGINEIYYKKSTDGGLNWMTDVRLTNAPGESRYASVCSSGPAVHTVWFDERDGNREIYYKRDPTGNAPPAPPLAPILSSPPNGSYNQPTSVRFIWYKSMNAVTYKLQVALDSQFTNMIVNDSTLTDSTLLVVNLTVNKYYWWRVNAKNAIGTSAFSTVWRFGTFPVSVKQIGTDIPKEFKLYSNIPNPFNPATTIKYDIPPSKGARGMMVQLIIYDVLGREIETLVNESQKPGSYEVTWDGSRYASGVYFYKLMTDEWTETKKMVLIK